MSEDNESEVTFVPLSKSIRAHGEMITQIEFNEPTGGDIISAGHPMHLRQEEDGATTMVINTKAIGSLISRMGGIPLSSVRDLSAKDFQACINKVMSFFDDAQ